MSGLILKIGYQMYVKTPFGPWYFRREVKKAGEQFPNGAHSNLETICYGFVNVTLIPYALTNYGFILWVENENSCILIDPGHATPFQSYLSRHHLSPGLILITHKHHDHSYGVKELHHLYPEAQIVCSAADRVNHATCLVSTSQKTITFNFESKVSPQESKSIKIRALLSPGHTIGSVIYSVSTQNDDAINSGGDNTYGLYFTGDTIFTGSIGKMFECNASTYFNSVRKFVESFLQHSCPLDNIYIFPAHEYGLSNLKFIVEKLNPNNAEAFTKMEWCKSKRESNEPTIPSSVMDELSFNPFLQLVLSDNKSLQTALSDKFEKYLNFASAEEISNEFVFPKSVSRKFCTRKGTDLPVRLFKEVRKLRDIT